MHMKATDNGETYRAEQGDTVIYGGMQLHFKNGEVRVEMAWSNDEKKLLASPTTGAGGGLVLELG